MNNYIVFGQYVLIFISIMFFCFIPFSIMKHFGFTLEEHNKNVQTMNKLMKKRRDYVDKQDFLDALETGAIDLNEKEFEDERD